jgi:hypothetical protein
MQINYTRKLHVDNSVNKFVNNFMEAAVSAQSRVLLITPPLLEKPRLCRLNVPLNKMRWNGEHICIVSSYLYTFHRYRYKYRYKYKYKYKYRYRYDYCVNRVVVHVDVSYLVVFMNIKLRIEIMKRDIYYINYIYIKYARMREGAYVCLSRVCVREKPD